MIRLQNTLTTEELAEVGHALAYGEFEQGKETAGWGVEQVKRNLQLHPLDASARKAQEIISNALQRNDEFLMAARPKLMRPPLFARYEPGMEYGSHTDNPLMGGPPHLRSDIAYTLFLNDPSEYDGGELVIEATEGEHVYKLGAGELILYPSGELHRVAPVIRGIRLVAVSWIQSLIRDAGKHLVLYDLDMIRRRLFERDGKSADFDLLTKTSTNLVRMWAET